jgi:hypothetical protein
MTRSHITTALVAPFLVAATIAAPASAHVPSRDTSERLFIDRMDQPCGDTAAWRCLGGFSASCAIPNDAHSRRCTGSYVEQSTGMLPSLRRCNARGTARYMNDGRILIVAYSDSCHG